MLKKLAGTALVVGAMIALAPTAGAFPLPEEFDKPWCQTTPTGSLFDQQGFRTICDGPIEPDGGWMRKRLFWGWSGRICTRAGAGIFSHRSCVDQDVPIHEYNFEEYRVTPDAVPFGEPGLLG